MSGSIPYLGSKISVISKSEIRYEGILYTIDAQDSIIALAKVQSFGTEDRPTEMPVPAKNDIYEYIIFRGTDIKKIEICETPKQLTSLHNDPAIVGLQVQQHSTPSVATFSPAAFSFNQPLGPIGSVGGTYYGNYSQQLSQQNLPSSGFSIGATQPSELSGGIGNSVGSVVGVVDPQPPAGGSQFIPTPIGAPPQSGISSHSRQQDVLAGSRSSTPGASRKSPVADASVQVTPPPPQQQQQEAAEKKRVSQPNNQRHLQQVSERQSREGQGNQARRGQGGNYQGQSNQYQGTRQYQSYYHSGQQQYQGQFRGGGGMGRGRATRRPQSRGRGVFNQVSRQRQDQQLFEKEFDFEQANIEFEELRTELAKTKIAENGDKKDEKKEDSGHETATTGDESEDSSSSVYYDKTKSFFDSISCEALERSKGKSQRSDWRKERKINVETFGVGTPRRGYYPRGRGGFYGRGGYYRNYNQAYYKGNCNSNYRGRGSGGIGGGSVGGGSNSSSASIGNPTRSSNLNDAVGSTAAASGNSSYASAVRSSVAAK